MSGGVQFARQYGMTTVKIIGRIPALDVADGDLDQLINDGIVALLGSEGIRCSALCDVTSVELIDGHYYVKCDVEIPNEPYRPLGPTASRRRCDE